MTLPIPALRLLRFLGLLASGALAGVGAPAPEPSSGWIEVSQYAFDLAHRTFAGQTEREARLGEAAALLNLQPRTAGNIERAAGLLDAVAAAAPDDDLGISARYLRARLEEVHRFAPQLAEASRRYQELMATGGDHPLAQQAAVRLTLLTLYSSPPSMSPAERVAAAEALGERLTDPAARRDHALLVGQACLYFELPLERAQRHLERALAAGVLNPSNRADLLVSLAEVARERGDLPRAERAYRDYLAENPRADRSAAVQRRLAELAPAAPPP